ncbi:hypothetical protein [Glycomyces dulcitolivorans]|uniref:hypothetical protein n=1 Tax=Glycomyces dulcitolivorans TaxID=2200759 RepID=UPI000DD3A907|nr:hypothetical protein [Glycomyces dulcitolivorans]
MAFVAGAGVVLGVALVVLPCALAATARFVARFPSGFHFVPYAALVPYMIAAMAATGLFSVYLMVLQFITALVLHLVIALRLRPRARALDAAASR